MGRSILNQAAYMAGSASSVNAHLGHAGGKCGKSQRASDQARPAQERNKTIAHQTKKKQSNKNSETPQCIAQGSKVSATPPTPAGLASRACPCAAARSKSRVARLGWLSPCCARLLALTLLRIDGGRVSSPRKLLCDKKTAQPAAPPKTLTKCPNSAKPQDPPGL